MKLSKLAQQCLESMRPCQVWRANDWTLEWNNREWSEYETLLTSLLKENPDTDRRLLEFFVCWRIQHAGAIGKSYSLDRLAQDLRDAWEQKNGVAGLETCFSGIHTGGIEA